MFVCCECCVLSGRGPCDGLITRPEESYRQWCVIVCDLKTSRMRRPWPALVRSATKKKWFESDAKRVLWTKELGRIKKFNSVLWDMVLILEISNTEWQAWQRNLIDWLHNSTFIQNLFGLVQRSHYIREFQSERQYTWGLYSYRWCKSSDHERPTFLWQKATPVIVGWFAGRM
jgi:hypothetical protein